MSFAENLCRCHNQPTVKFLSVCAHRDAGWQSSCPFPKLTTPHSRVCLGTKTELRAASWSPWRPSSSFWAVASRERWTHSEVKKNKQPKTLRVPILLKFFLHSENSWFLSSSPWPCEAADVESRTRVLLRLGERTSHRGTLEVLSHLPGLKEPNGERHKPTHVLWSADVSEDVFPPPDFADVSNYCSVFNAHLQVCVDRQTLPVASDLVDFMLSKQLAVEPALLQALLQKLGRQNLWLRAREVFRRESSFYILNARQVVVHTSGCVYLVRQTHWVRGTIKVYLPPLVSWHYWSPVNWERWNWRLHSRCSSLSTGPSSSRQKTTPAASTSLWKGSASLGVWGVCCHSLSSASSSSSSSRTRSGESEYLSAGSRVLTAASIPQPKLTVQYTAVNSSQEQVFTLDVSSARSWLHHNHLWANEVWAHWPQPHPRCPIPYFRH